jgi:GNAT superfamily N-acetyltransferase
VATGAGARARYLVRPIRDDERDEFARLVAEHWESPVVISREVAHDVRELPALVAVEASSGDGAASGGGWLGMASYRFEAGECELVQLVAFERGRGVGTALVQAVTDAARAARARRVWLTTTNDNLDAIRFYQRRGFKFIWIWRDAIARARQIKPGIPLVGSYGIPITDEIEMELLLEAD